MDKLKHHFTIRNLGLTLLGAISLTIIIIITLLIRIAYLKAKLKRINKELNMVNHLQLPRRKLKNAKAYTFDFNQALINKFTNHCKKLNSSNSSRLEFLINNDLKGGKYYG